MKLSPAVVSHLQEKNSLVTWIRVNRLNWLDKTHGNKDPTVIKQRIMIREILLRQFEIPSEWCHQDAMQYLMYCLTQVARRIWQIKERKLHVGSKVRIDSPEIGVVYTISYFTADLCVRMEGDTQQRFCPSRVHLAKLD